MIAVLLAVVPLLAVGCRSTLQASATCSFKAQRTELGSSRWSSPTVIPPDSACSFSLNAPIKRAAHAEQFANAFQKMLGAAPDNGETPPKVKLEIKKDAD